MSGRWAVLTWCAASCVATALGAVPAAAQAPTTAAPPASGSWTVGPDTTSTAGGAPIVNVKGAFTVTTGAGAVTNFHGTTGGTLSSGCVSGVRLVLVGSVPILHFDGPTGGGAEGSSDYYWAGGNGKVKPYARVTLTFQGPGRHAKVKRGSAMFRIYFPGSIGATSGAEDWGNITYTNPVGGICNLQFTPSQ